MEYDRADAGKLIPLTQSYATMAFKNNNRLKSVEALPWNLEEETTIELYPAFVGVHGVFDFSWDGIESIPEGMELTLHDRDTGESLNMREVTSHQFVVEAQEMSKAPGSPWSVINKSTPIVQKAVSDTTTRFAITITPAESVVSNEPVSYPKAYSLSQNYPNPFNPSTTIAYSIKKPGHVRISVYNILGGKVAELIDEFKAEGSYNVNWNAQDVASGVYYYRLEFDGQAITRKMNLIK